MVSPLLRGCAADGDEPACRAEWPDGASTGGSRWAVGVYGPTAVHAGWWRGAPRNGTGRDGSAWAEVMRAFYRGGRRGRRARRAGRFRAGARSSGGSRRRGRPRRTGGHRGRDDGGAVPGRHAGPHDQGDHRGVVPRAAERVAVHAVRGPGGAFAHRETARQDGAELQPRPGSSSAPPSPAPGPAGDWAAPGLLPEVEVRGGPCRSGVFLAAHSAAQKKRAWRARFCPFPAACRKTGGRVDRGRGARGRAHMMGRSYLRPRPSPVPAHAPYSGRSGWRSGLRSFAACLLERLTLRGTDAREPHGSSGQKLGGAPVLLDEAGSCRRAGSVRVSHASVA